MDEPSLVGSLPEPRLPLQNRVTPEGEIIATPHRGLMFGNRGGEFHLPGQRLGNRRWASKQWIACLLRFKGRRRAGLMMPHRYTELFFLDEATALAAGHRPCFECRRAQAQQFAALLGAVRGRSLRAGDIDAILHAERIGVAGGKATFQARLGALPPGTFVRGADGARCYLVVSGALLAWSPSGYTQSEPLIGKRTVAVLTPPAIVAVLAAGYQPMLHPSAGAGRP
jgi:hypothetical protein